MIYVVADDLTGAAELAGIARDFGLHVSLLTEPLVYREGDVIVYNTNSRSLTKEDAITRVHQFHKILTLEEGDLIYVKTDSVLRGYVAEEFAAILPTFSKQSIVYLPCNPSLGRTIQNGLYFVGGERLDKTIFTKDPEFPRQSADVTRLLTGELPVQIVDFHQTLPAEGVIIANASTTADMYNWAMKTVKEGLLAGAGDFFEAILTVRTNKKRQNEVKTSPLLPFLYVSGTAVHATNESIWGIPRTDERVLEIDEDVLAENKSLDVASLITTYKKAYIVFSKSIAKHTPQFLRSRMAEIVSSALQQARISELIIEGGSSAQSILDLLNIRSWDIEGQYGRGVVRMRSEKLTITVKPGSYPLPNNLIEYLQA